MAWISKYDTTFMVYVRRKYEKKFKDFDSFSDWLFFEKNKEDTDNYYEELEQVVKEYAYWQVNKVKENKSLE